MEYDINSSTDYKEGFAEYHEHPRLVKIETLLSDLDGLFSKNRNAITKNSDFSLSLLIHSEKHIQPKTHDLLKTLGILSKIIHLDEQGLIEFNHLMDLFRGNKDVIICCTREGLSDKGILDPENKDAVLNMLWATLDQVQVAKTKNDDQDETFQTLYTRLLQIYGRIERNM